MIRLSRVSLREIRLPLLEPFETSAGVVEQRRMILLELADAGGTTAWSECVAQALPDYSPDTVDTCWLALCEWIIPTVLDWSFDSPREAHALLERRIRGHKMARAAVEMGIWAVEAAINNSSLAALLNSESASARALKSEPRKFVETGVALGMQRNPRELVSRIISARDEGYRRIKIKITPGRDEIYARAALEAIGDIVKLSVDANASYSLQNREHVSMLEELDTLGLSMIEQPLAHDDLVHHADLQRLLSTPICLDESIAGDASAEEMLALGSARIVNLKAGRVGGFQQALAIHDRCADAGIPVWCGGMLESGIGRAYNVALASLPNFTLPGDLSPSARYWERDIVKKPWTMDMQGRVAVPLAKPGLGVEVDTAYVDKLTVRSQTFSV
ncbi:MAG TPA: o-succinylbenzoate synthase [Gemmatimonadaceae bacterium]|nr:o-succinylbenzoate synthase [Gemmatimonadaceae bacterium]